MQAHSCISLLRRGHLYQQAERCEPDGVSMKPGHFLVGLLTAFAAVAAWHLSPASAQGLPPPSTGPIQIVAVTPIDSSPSESRLLLSFNQQLPQFSVVNNDGNTGVLAFADSSLGPSLVFPVGRHGLIQSMNFAQNGKTLTLTINGTAPIHITASPIAARAVAVVITDLAPPGPKFEPVPTAPVSHVDGGAGDVFEIVPLKYADVSEIIGLLTTNQSVKPNDHFTPEEPAFGSAGIQGAYPGAGLSNPGFNQGVSFAGAAVDSLGQTIDDATGIDRRLNAIILKGPAARVARIKEEIAKLDVPVTSVVFETVFVELTETGARNVGLDFNNANNQIATASYSYASGNYPGVANTARSGGVVANLQLAVYAQIAKGNGRIISKPRIAAQSGSTAKIITGDALPILTSIALSGVNAVQQQVQYVNVGVTLQIAPRVSDDGFVTSHVFAEVSSVTGVSQGYPTISQREASTSATVRDGDSFVIGGLTQETDLSHHNKIPLLGDVPLLGELFKSENSSTSNTDLYIVVTPHIVRGQDGAAELKKDAPAQ
jgi:general secretion pathway protein D